MSAEPVQYPQAPKRCGAKTRGARGGRPCRTWAMPNGRCRMHGGKAGGPTGPANGAWRGGKYSRAGKELITGLHQMRRDGEALLAVSLDAHGLSRKLPKSLRRRTHIRRARAAAKARVKEGEKP